MKGLNNLSFVVVISHFEESTQHPAPAYEWLTGTSNHEVEA